MIADRFSGRAEQCVACVRLCVGDNFRKKRPLTWIFDTMTRLHTLSVMFERQGHMVENGPVCLTRIYQELR